MKLLETPGLAKLDKAYHLQQKYYPKIVPWALKTAGVGAGGAAGLGLLGELLNAHNQNQNQ